MAFNRALRRIGVNAGKLFFGKIHATFGARMRYLVTGGSRFDPAIARDFYSFGIDVLNAYGLTETSGGVFLNPPGQRIVFGSVGQPFPGVEAKIVEEKIVGLQPVEEGAPPAGEIAIRGAIVMKGYWNRPEATAEVLRDGWLYTGDLGYFDSGGNLFITGRRKEVIVLANGKNVYPEEVEAHYLQAQYVKEICVMALEARPGDPASERLHAVVVPNFELLRERKIVNSKEAIRFEIEALSHKIASTKRLGSYDIWQEDLPRTTTRKLKRFQIEKKVRELKQTNGSGDSGIGTENEKPLTNDEQSWLEREDVKRALAIIRESSRESSRNRLDAIRPTHNLELDLGLDSMQRVELLTALEQQLGGEVPESQLAEIYSVRDLVDAVLRSASRGEGQARAAAPAWSTILSEPVTDPDVLALAGHNIFAEVFFFLLGKLIYLFALDRFHLKIRGLENLPEKGPYLLCSNHQSYIDPLVLAGGAAVAPVSRHLCVGHERHFRSRIHAAAGAMDSRGGPRSRREPRARHARRSFWPQPGTHSDSLSRRRAHQRRQPESIPQGCRDSLDPRASPDCPGRDRGLLRSLAAPQKVPEVHRSATGIRQADSTSAGE